MKIEWVIKGEYIYIENKWCNNYSNNTQLWVMPLVACSMPWIRELRSDQRSHWQNQSSLLEVNDTIWWRRKPWTFQCLWFNLTCTVKNGTPHLFLNFSWLCTPKEKPFILSFGNRERGWRRKVPSSDTAEIMNSNSNSSSLPHQFGKS